MNFFKILLIVIIMIGMLTESAFSANRKIYADFEESGNTAGQVWAHYAENFNDGKRADRWRLSSNAFSGKFCIESMDPNIDGNTGDSRIGFKTSVNWGEEIFIRYMLKVPNDWQPSATDANKGANHLRILSGSSKTIAEATFYEGWIHWYDWGAKWKTAPILRDNKWHEIAIYIKMPSNASTNNGVLRVWRDGNGTYNESNALWNFNDIKQTIAPITEFSVASPSYYKGPVDGNWTYWIDNYEVWDGIPSSSSSTATNSTNNSQTPPPPGKPYVVN